MKKILITGASGTLGKELCRVMAANKTPFTAISRKRIDIGLPGIWMKADLNTGEGLEDLPGTFDTIIHLASNAADKHSKSDPELTDAILKFSGKSGVSHFIYMSIVGIDKIPYQYYRQKLYSENLVFSGNLPFTILRATQFHQLLDYFLGILIKYPVALLPKKFKFQPIDPFRIAVKLFELYQQHEPVNGIINIGGPEVLNLSQMYKDWLIYKKRKAIVLNLPLPGKTAKAFIKGYNTCKEKDMQSITWKEFLKSKHNSKIYNVN